jgi:chemotaxis protein CheZ
MFTAERRLAELAGGDVVALPTGAPVMADNAPILDAIAELKADLLAALGTSFGPGNEPAAPPDNEDEALQAQRDGELDMVKTEIHALSFAIQQTKEEIAALYHSAEPESRMAVLQHSLDAVVAATEQATDDILEAAEQIDQSARNIQNGTEEPYLRQLADEIGENVTKVFEASNFQDLTGQRLNKVVNTLKYIEERVAKVIEIWGEDEIAAIDVPEAPKGLDDLDRIIEQKPANIEKISQDDIDKMFD